MSNYKEALSKIAELVGYKFNNEVTKVQFERVALEGGEVFISNQLETELTLGDTIYIETEEGFELAPAGTHRLEDDREIVLDENSVLIEIREEPETEVEIVVEETKEDEELSVVSNGEVTKLKEAIHDLLLSFNKEVSSINEKFEKLEKDYNQFKQSESIKPLKEEKKFKQNFSDFRLEIINSLRNK